MVAWYLEHDVGGLYANCLSSEMFHLSIEERLLLVKMAVQVVAGRSPVAATGTWGNRSKSTFSFASRWQMLGADVVMLVVPDFLDQENELERYYLTIARQVNVH